MNGAGGMRVDELVREGRERGASDVHVAANEQPVMRIDGELIRIGEEILRGDELESFLGERLDARARQALHTLGFCDAAVRTSSLGPIRVHAFAGVRGLRCAIRLFPLAIPHLETLDVPRVIESFALRKSGLVLVVGPAGSGKTTLLAAMVDALNRAHPRHVVTLEDPVEYVHQSNRCIIAQCEIGRDGDGLAGAINGTLRADPDVIVIGELRDVESMRGALGAAETGHLILASLHTSSAAQAVERIVDAFPTEGRAQIRVQIAQTLAGIVALRLVVRARGGGRRAATEILVASDAVRNLLREGKAHQLRSAIQTGRAAGMQTLEMHLAGLVERGEITRATALACAEQPAEIAGGGAA